MFFMLVCNVQFINTRVICDKDMIFLWKRLCLSLKNGIFARQNQAFRTYYL